MQPRGRKSFRAILPAPNSMMVESGGTREAMILDLESQSGEKEPALLHLR
jgi:hypothetical protein